MGAEERYISLLLSAPPTCVYYHGFTLPAWPEGRPPLEDAGNAKMNILRFILYDIAKMANDKDFYI